MRSNAAMFLQNLGLHMAKKQFLPAKIIRIHLPEPDKKQHPTRPYVDETLKSSGLYRANSSGMIGTRTNAP